MASLSTLAAHILVAQSVGRTQPCLDDRGYPHSRSQTRIFAHNDPRDLERQLSDLDPDAPKLVAFEPVYSMDGDIAPIVELCDVAEAYGARPISMRYTAVVLWSSAAASRPRGTESSPDSNRGHVGQGFRLMGGYVAAVCDICDFIRTPLPVIHGHWRRCRSPR